MTFKKKINPICYFLIALGVSGVPGIIQADYCYSNQNYTTSQDFNRNQNDAYGNAYNSSNSNISDQEITKKVKDKLSSGWFSTGYDQVNVSVNNGIVTLQGSVPTWDDKEKIEKEIRNIDGVRGLSFRLNVQDTNTKDSRQRSYAQNQNLSDQEIANKIRDKISSGWFSKGYDQVDVQVNNGMVILQGFVNSQDDRAKVEKEIRNIDGVKNINNQLAVQDTHTSNNERTVYSNTSSMTDQELTKKIQDKVGSGWFTTGYDQVNVRVNNGTVTLQGTVKTWVDKEKIEKEVRNIEGVKLLNSEIKVQDMKDMNAASNKDSTLDTSTSNIDNQLNQKIRDNVTRGWLWNGYKDVKLNTSNGVVTLEGTVDNLSDQQKLMTEIQKVDGVRAVKSNLRIRNNQ